MPLCSPSVRMAVARLRIQSAAQRNQLAFWRLAQTSQARNNSPLQPTPFLFEKLFDAAGERQRKALQVMVFVDVRLAFLQPHNKHLVVRLLVACVRIRGPTPCESSTEASHDPQTILKCVLTNFCDGFFAFEVLHMKPQTILKPSSNAS